MTRGPSAPSRLLIATLVDWTGTGSYLAITAIFLTRSAHLTPAQAGLALSGAGLVALAGNVHVSRLGDRFGQREVLLALHGVRAIGFVGLAGLHGLPVLLALLGIIALADQAAAGLNQALAGELIGADGRVVFMARMRTVMNVGISLGLVPAAIALAGPTTPFGLLLAANAASYLAAAAIIATLPRSRTRASSPVRRRLLIPSAPTTALISVDGLMSMWSVVLNVGLPLWVLQATSASPALVAVLYATNTVLAVLLQTRVSRRVRTYVHAAQAQRLAGLFLAACCGFLAAAAFGDRSFSTVVLCLGVVCLTLGELLKASASWQITFTLAPTARAAEFFATYGLGRIACQVCGPALVTGVVLALGSAGWLLLAAVFVAAAAATPGLARRARARPVTERRPAEPPGGATFSARTRYGALLT